MASSRRTAKRKAPPRARRRGPGLMRALLLLSLFGVVAGGAGVAWLWPRCQGPTCPSVEALREYEPPQATRVFDREGKLLAALGPERRIVVPLARIPVHVAGAFLSVEDRRFFAHDGVDYRRAVGALVHDIQAMSFREGFSTLTMQLARNVFPEHLTREKTLKRKMWEIVLAREIEQRFSKDEILEMYLNQIYLGNGLYGVEAASEGYFGRPVSRLSVAQAALLAALPKAPSTYDPRRHPVAAVERRNLVLGQMAAAGVVSAEAAERARAEPLELAPPPEALGDAPYAVEEVRRELRERFGEGADEEGYRVYTSIDPALQRSAREALRSELADVEAGELGNYRGPKCSGKRPEHPERCLQGLFVALDVHTGDVLALVGGRDFGQSQFDRVTQAKRQAGSAFKPFVYATALAEGVTIPTPLIGPGAADFEGDYRPADHIADSVSVDLRDGLKLSSNRAAVALGERVGVADVVSTAHSLGITTEVKELPSTFLGAADVVPLEMVAAYTAFAGEGARVTPRLVRRVEDSRGKVVYQAPVKRVGVLSPEVAFLTTSLMKDVVDHGTGYRVRQALGYEVPAAGKTGTTNNSADAWFIGYTPDVAAGAWIGFDQPRRIMAGADGGRLAAPIWGKVMADYYRTHPVPTDWSPPSGVVSVEIDRTSGARATPQCPPEQVASEWFLVGTEPTEYCPLHERGMDGWLRRRLRDFGSWF